MTWEFPVGFMVHDAVYGRVDGESQPFPEVNEERAAFLTRSLHYRIQAMIERTPAESYCLYIPMKQFHSGLGIAYLHAATPFTTVLLLERFASAPDQYAGWAFYRRLL